MARAKLLLMDFPFHPSRRMSQLLIKGGGRLCCALFLDQPPVSPMSFDETSPAIEVKWARPAVKPYRNIPDPRSLISDLLSAISSTDDEANEALPLSGCHLTPELDWKR
jgi:hypothetical protein